MQLSVLDGTIDADLAGIKLELDKHPEGRGDAKPRTPRKRVGDFNSVVFRELDM